MRVRKKAAWALAEIGDERAVEPLINALRDSNARVRNRAAWALEEIKRRLSERDKKNKMI